MLSLRNTLRLAFAALMVLAMLGPAFRFTTLASEDDRGPADKGVSSNDSAVRGPDPCEQALKPPGNANGLHERCEAQGTGGGVAKGDFNGDGFADIAIGVPHEGVNGIPDEGAVNVIYGSRLGLTATGDQLLIEPDTVANVPATGDGFGSALASGDFNGDGFSDIAIGAPGKKRGTVEDAGAVFIVNGSATGLDVSTMKSALGIAVGRGGASLVWADFNGDGFGDLAVGVPNGVVTFEEPITCIDFGIAVAGAGVVQVFYGSSTGIKSTGSQIFHAGPTGCVQGDNPNDTGLVANENDHYGAVLAAGRFHGGTADDLVVGVPSKDIGGIRDGGAVFIIPGGPNKLRGPSAQTLGQDLEGVGGATETGDQFGRALAVGDFDGDGRDDLAVGVPFEDLASNSKDDAGAVQVFFGARSGEPVTTDGSQFISQANLPDSTLETGDRFGWALAANDFDGDGFDDLAVGSPGEDIGAIADAGIVHVLYGAATTGPSLTRVQIWHQDIAGIADTAEVGDQFGFALSAWNFGRGPESDLAIGVPFEDLVSVNTQTQQPDAGAIHVIYGTPSGLNATAGAGAQFWTQDSTGILDSVESGDRFGSALY